jgi:hypothetical protein
MCRALQPDFDCLDSIWIINHYQQAFQTGLGMNKHQLTGQNVGRVFNSASVHMCAMHLFCYEAKRPKLKLTQPKQLLGSLPLDITLPAWQHSLTLSLSTIISMLVSKLSCHLIKDV